MKLDNLTTQEKDMSPIDDTSIHLSPDSNDSVTVDVPDIPDAEPVQERALDTRLVSDGAVSILILNSLLKIINLSRNPLSKIDVEGVIMDVRAILGEDMVLELYFFTPDQSIIIGIPSEDQPMSAVSVFGFHPLLGELLKQDCAISQYIVPLNTH